MRRILVGSVLAALIATVAYSAAASKQPAPPARAVNFTETVLARDVRIPVGQTGSYAFPLATLPGVSTADATVSSGLAVEGGQIEFSAPPRTVLQDTASGLVVVVSFSVKRFSGSPYVHVIQSTATPR